MLWGVRLSFFDSLFCIAEGTVNRERMPGQSFKHENQGEGDSLAKAEQDLEEPENQNLIAEQLPNMNGLFMSIG